jgi:DNA repair exonuclease SbcCD ATPase subunit
MGKRVFAPNQEQLNFERGKIAIKNSKIDKYEKKRQRDFDKVMKARRKKKELQHSLKYNTAQGPERKLKELKKELQDSKMELHSKKYDNNLKKMKKAKKGKKKYMRMLGEYPINSDLSHAPNIHPQP